MQATAVEAEAIGWTFTGHVCRACLGAVLQHGADYICSICRATGRHAPASICRCGLLVKNSTKKTTFRCGPNPKVGPQNPAADVILFGSGEDAAA